MRRLKVTNGLHKIEAIPREPSSPASTSAMPRLPSGSAPGPCARLAPATRRSGAIIRGALPARSDNKHLKRTRGKKHSAALICTSIETRTIPAR